MNSILEHDMSRFGGSVNEATVEVRLNIAAQIAAADRAGIYDEKNRRYDWSSLAEAVEADDCYFVPVEEDVFVADFDRPGSEAASSTLYLEMLLAGVRAVLLDSGGRGADGEQRRHVLAGGMDEADLERWASRGNTLGGAALRNIRPPFTIHRSRAARSVPVTGHTPGEILARLSGEDNLSALPIAEVRRITLGHRAGEDRSTEIRDRLVVLIEHGWTRAECELLLSHGVYVLSEIYLEARSGRRHQTESGWFAYLWEDAYARAEKFPLRRRIRQTRAAALDSLLSRRRDTRSRGTDLRLLEVLFELADGLGRPRVSLASRDAQVRANLANPGTVAKAFARLRRDNYLRIVRGRREGVHLWRQARTYEVVLAEDVPDATEVKALSYLNHVLFRNGTGLGSGVALTYTTLVLWAAEDRTADVASVATYLKVSPRTVQRHVQVLADHGLVREEAGSLELTEVVPDESMSARARDARDRAVRRHEKERRDREHFFTSASEGSDGEDKGEPHPQGGVLTGSVLGTGRVRPPGAAA